MTQSQKLVLEFARRFDCYHQLMPAIPSQEICAHRIDLLHEELFELREAIKAGDLTAVADALGDLQYVLDGAACAFGIDLEPVIAEIHRTNMLKVWPDGTTHKRSDGKIIKPPGWKPPELHPILQQQKPLKR